jgi:hypothetical protein
MSFDVYVGNWDGSYTRNMGAFFAWAIDGTEPDAPMDRCDSRDGGIFGKPRKDGLAGLHGVVASEAIGKIESAIERIKEASREKLRSFEASNSCGTYGQATCFLCTVLDACTRYPEEILEVFDVKDEGH